MRKVVVTLENAPSRIFASFGDGFDGIIRTPRFGERDFRLITTYLKVIYIDLTF